MSQHFFNTEYQGRPVEVVMGWDRPLQEYFLWIRWLDRKEYDGERFLWHNLDHDVKERHLFYTFVRVLESFGIEVPKEMLDGVLRDGQENAGSKKVIY